MSRESGLFQKKRGQYALPALLLAGVLGVILLLVGNLGSRGDGQNTEVETDARDRNSAQRLADYTETLESRIAALCETVDGVSSVRVAVTLASGYEYVYAKDATAEENGTGDVSGSYTYVVIGSGSSEQVVYLSEKPPKIGGIGIVCRGGGNAAVQKELIALVCAAFDVGSNQVYITEGGVRG